jgi:hypothetical protein
MYELPQQPLDRSSRAMLLLAGRVASVAFAAAVFVDLVSKVLVVSADFAVVYHDTASKMAVRLIGCFVTVACVAALTVYATRTGLGRQFGLWIGCGAAIGGIVANGVSATLWSRGVPDFIPAGGGWFWNVADAEIVAGTTLGLLSYALAAVIAYSRTVRPPSGA